MGKSVKRNWLLITIGFILLINVGFVLGAGAMNALESAFGGIGNIDLGALYMKYPQLFDGAFYIIFFIALFKTVMGKIELFKGNNTMPVIMGIVFAISMMVLSNMMKPRLLLLKAISPIALLIAAGAMGIFIYQMIKDMTKANVFAAAISIAVVLALITFITSPSIFGARTGGAKALTGVKQYATLSLFILFPVGIGQVWRNLGLNNAIHKGPSGSAHTDEKTFFPKQTEAIEKVEGVQKGLEKGLSDDPGEKDILETEEGLENFDRYDNDLKAQAAKFTIQLGDLEKEEKEGERREAGMLTALSAYGQNIDDALSKINGAEALDQAGKIYITQNVQGIAQTCVQIVNNQKQINAKRKDTISKSFTEDIGKINEAIEHFSKIDSALTKVEGNISKDIGKSLLKRVDKKIRADEKKVKEAMKKLESGKSKEQMMELGSGVDALRKDLDKKKQSAEKVKQMTTELDGFTKALHDKLSEVKTAVGQIKSAENNVNQQEAKNVGFLTKFDKAVQEMDLASEQLNRNMMELAQKTELAEQVPVEAINGVAKIFDTMISTKPEKLGLQPEMKIFYADNIIPFINEIKVVIGNGASVDELIAPLQKGIEDVNRAYESLKVAAAEIINESRKDINTSKAISETMSYVDKVIVSEKTARTQMTNEVLRRLDQATSEITNEIQTVEAEIQNLQHSEQKVLGELSKALQIIVKHKSRVDDQFKQKADNFNIKMAEATQNITQERKAA